MDDTHERYEELAVGHVLGGLPAPAAAEFRRHLAGCRDCRLRVAELRGIADDLAAAERDERTHARVRTTRRTVEAADETFGDVDPRGPALTTRHLGIGALVIVVCAALLAFWNLHLRTQVVTLTGLADQQAEALAGVASGVPVATEFIDTGAGLVVVDRDEVAFTLVDLPPLQGAEAYVVWLVGTTDGDVAVPAATRDGRLAGRIDDRGARQLVVTAQTGASVRPDGRVLVRADLTRAVE